MGKGRYLFNKFFVLSLMSGIMVCLGMESLEAEPLEDILVVAQASPSQPGSSTTPLPSVPPQLPNSATTQTPSGPQPKTPAPPGPPTPPPSPETSASPPSTTIPAPGSLSPPPFQRRGLPRVPQRPVSPTPQLSTPTTQPPSAPAQAQPSAPTPGQEPSPVGPFPGTPVTRPSSPVSTTAPRTGSSVVFNFDNADIYEVIRVMSEILKINYIIDPRVKGVVNIHTSGQISSADVFPIFQSILRLNGSTAVRKDGIYEIVPLPEAKKLPSPPSPPQDSGKPISEERYIIQILPLKYIPVTEVSKMIKPFLSDGADIVEHPPSNILIIGDLASNVKKSVDIIGLFDIDIFTDLRVRIYPILNADVVEVAKEMEKIFSSFDVSTKSGRGVGITFTPIARINSLLAVSSIPNIFEKVEGWLKELDKIPGEGSKLSVFVYYVQNAKAKDLAEVLKEVFVKGKEKKVEKAATPAETTPRGTRPSPTPTTPPALAKEEAGGLPEGEINIVVDETTNSLIIKAFHRDYRAILETIKKLDIYPKQVLIEALLAEITLDDTNKFGIEWARIISSNPPNAQEGMLNSRPPVDSSGTFVPFGQSLAEGTFFRYSIVQLGGKFMAAINAAATDNRLKIISSPNLIASNNKEAKLQVGSSQPILTSTYSYGSTSSTTIAGTGTVSPSTGVIEGTIEYKDIGIILTITPRISDGGLITLELQIEKSDVNEKALPLGNLSNVPVFTKKTAKTILSVLEGQTIVIGGLIEDTKNVTKSGIPLLSKIPLLGALFGYQTYEKTKTELILLMTPHIITDHVQSDAVTKEFKEKVEGIKKELEEKEKRKKEKKEK
jgi:general secretion pathway protein D